MSKISIGSGVKVIEVNDAGETIRLPAGDDAFLTKFYALLEELESKAGALKMDEGDILGSMEAVVAFDGCMKTRIDELFGPETCRKVFGDILPGIDMFLEFFEALIPFLEEFQKARIEKLNKYSASRVGSSV